MSGGAAEGVWGLNGGGQSVGGAAVSNSARRYIMESNTEPMDQTRAERRIPMLIVFRVGGKSQFCLESAMSELARERGPSSSSESNHPFVRARSWQCKSFSLSSTATTRVSSIISRREAEFENQFRILMAKRREGAGGTQRGFKSKHASHVAAMPLATSQGRSHASQAGRTGLGVIAGPLRRRPGCSGCL